MTTTRSDISLAGVATLAAALTRAAYAPAVLVTLDPAQEQQGGAADDECTHARRVLLSADLLDDNLQLAGTLAHEIAHHALGHGEHALAWFRHITLGAVAVSVAAVIAGMPLWLATAAFAVAVASHLLAARVQRQQEYDADAHSVRLLDAVGLDGRGIVTATLQAIPQETRWYRLAGWLAGSHPTPAARRRRLATSFGKLG